MIDCQCRNVQWNPQKAQGKITKAVFHSESMTIRHKRKNSLLKIACNLVGAFHPGNLKTMNSWLVFQTFAHALCRLSTLRCRRRVISTTEFPSLFPRKMCCSYKTSTVTLCISCSSSTQREPGKLFIAAGFKSPASSDRIALPLVTTQIWNFSWAKTVRCLA